METTPTQAGELFERCEADANGLPARLIGERDLLLLPPLEEFAWEFDSLPSRNGRRLRVTTHRICWQADSDDSAWLVLRLDGVASAEISSRWMRKRRCLLNLCGGVVFSTYLKFTTESLIDDLASKLQEAISTAAWREGSFNASAMGGLQRIIDTREARLHACGDTLEVALADLDSLRQHAVKVVAAARQVAAAEAGGGYAGSGGGTEPTSDGFRRLLEDFGCLLGADGKPVASGSGSRAGIEADVVRVCTAALETKKGRSVAGGLGAMLLAHDAFCLINRARGTAMVSPEEVMDALRRCSKDGGKLRLRSLGKTGAIAVSLACGDNGSGDDQKLERMTEASPLTAFSLAAESGLTAAEAGYLLSDAEERGILVRDDAPEGVFYYRNFFNEYA
eukprot:TRINITY_DN57820_c0_g1_i1.p1 TRINITY_DN57820_c0_g1~~TRINITY_DN57820_c0_g1_i1.p1  ORF type:complete len:393 (-),score=82.23 TRINITY_DN57820_c0_g1_i1:109-1287(-)